MKTLHTQTVCALSLLFLISIHAMAFEEFAVNPSDRSQELPDVDNGKIVWQQNMDANGWDIYGADLLGPNAPAFFVVDEFEFDQQQPAIWDHYVVWQDNSAGDWDVYFTDITDLNAPNTQMLTDFVNDETRPAIHGNTVVWQHEFDTDDWDIYAADITDPNEPDAYLVRLTDNDQYYANQQAPCIYRNRLIWQDNNLDEWDIASADFWLRTTPSDQVLSASNLPQQNPALWGDWVVWQEDFGDGDVDIYAADISDPANPVEVSLVADTAAQIQPDISGHLVVWQDNRHGNEDIYGYNLITRQEFQITTDSANQTNPAISGNLVVWQDMRDGVANIYAVWLDGPETAECEAKLAGDIDGDCRVNLNDFMKIAETWLQCNRIPAEACLNDIDTE